MSKRTKSRLIIVSNRLPIQLTERSGKIYMRESDGGLISSIKSYFEKTAQNSSFSEKMWIGTADFPQQRWIRYASKNISAFVIEPLFIPAKEYSQYYNGFCNAILWPLFHYFPSYVEYSDEAFKNYEEVNKLFCEKLLSILRPGDTVWIHDYHLLLLAGMLRKERSDVSIGFFLHIPFPSYDIFRLLHTSWKIKLVKGLLGADLIGFHCHQYVHHFLDAVEHTLHVNHQLRAIRWDNRKIQVDVFPLGIDFEKFHTVQNTSELKNQKQSIRNKFQGQKIIFSVDRLDYTKGITHRLSGFERFLELYPAWRKKVTFILVVVPSRQIISKYKERKKMIEEQISRINGKYSSLQWQPILYQYNTLKFLELSMMYQVAHVALITPLRDGMNLVAKEFVASRKHQDGVLILGELAGAAHEMHEALIVNPTDKNEVANTIFEAVTMHLADQKARIAQIQERLMKSNVVEWVSSFIHGLNQAHQLQSTQPARLIKEKDIIELKIRFDKVANRLLLIDYDGTLAPFHVDPKSSLPSTPLLKWLSSVTANQQNQVAIISGRPLSTLQTWFKDINLHLIGEHGAHIKFIDHPEVKEDQPDFIHTKTILSTLDMFTTQCPGSFVEKKENALAWHYRAADPKIGFTRSRKLINYLFYLLRNTKINVIDGHQVVEIRSSEINKGIAAKKIKQLLKPDFVLAIGDDTTDEDMFEAFETEGTTIKVGTDITKAKYRLLAQRNVLPFLQKLTQPHT